MTNVIEIPFGKGEVKVMLKKEIMKCKTDGKGITAEEKCKCRRVFRRNRLEDTVLTRLRFDHTRLKKTLF